MTKYERMLRILLIVLALMPTFFATVLGIIAIGSDLGGLTFLAIPIIVVWFGIDTVGNKK